MRLQLIPIVFLYVSLLLTDWYIYADVARMSRKGAVRRSRSLPATLFLVFAIVVIALLTVTVVLPHREVERDIQAKMWMLYTVLAIFFSQTVYTITGLLGYIPLLWKGRRRNVGLWVGLPLALFTFVMAWWGAFVERRRIEVVRADIVSENLPKSFDGYNIVQFSDIHLGTWGSDTTFVSQLVDSINGCHPDLIVFTGDIVNRETSEMEPHLKVLSRLHARDGVLSVLGNHDYGDYISWSAPSDRDANNALMQVWQKQIGWKLLNNERTFVTSESGDSIVVIGVENWGEPPFNTYGRLADAYPISADSAYNINDARYKILLTHNPEHWNREVSKISNIDLTLSGHTHAMQFMIRYGDVRWSPAVFKYPRWGGLYECRSHKGSPMMLYVNIGAGEVALPMRIGATPEISLLTLRHKSISGRKSRK